MTKYKCGHESNTIFMNNTILGLSSYATWADTTGYNGDKSQCFDCYLKELDDKLQHCKCEECSDAFEEELETPSQFSTIEMLIYILITLVITWMLFTVIQWIVWHNYTLIECIQFQFEWISSLKIW